MRFQAPMKIGAFLLYSYSAEVCLMSVFKKINDRLSYIQMPFWGGGYFASVILIQGKTKEENILIDSGESGAYIDSHLLPALEKIGLSIRDIGLLLCTHNHNDHAGGHPRIRELFDGKIAAMAIQNLPACGVTPDLLLQDGDLLPGGIRLIRTPGHCDGAASFYLEKERILITGDSFQARGTDGCALSLIGDPTAYRESVAKIQRLSPDMILAGHAFEPFDFEIVGQENVHAFLQESLDHLTRSKAQLQAWADEIPLYPLTHWAAMLTHAQGRDRRKINNNGVPMVRALLQEMGLHAAESN